MLSWLLPKETRFYDFFIAHAKIGIACAEEFCNLRRPQIIKQFETEADAITQQCKEALHKTFITPIDREDIFRLISCMDNIVDFIDEATTHFSVYRFTTPTADFSRLAQLLLLAICEVEKAVTSLAHLHKPGELINSIRAIHHLEMQADTALIHALATLFDNETNTLLIVKWKEIYELIEQSIDSCKDVANIIEGIILEHA